MTDMFFVTWSFSELLLYREARRALTSALTTKPCSNCLGKLLVEVATNPWHPNSTGRILHFQLSAACLVQIPIYTMCHLHLQSERCTGRTSTPGLWSLLTCRTTQWRVINWWLFWISPLQHLPVHESLNFVTFVFLPVTSIFEMIVAFSQKEWQMILYDEKTHAPFICVPGQFIAHTSTQESGLAHMPT